MIYIYNSCHVILMYILLLVGKCHLPHGSLSPRFSRITPPPSPWPMHGETYCLFMVNNVDGGSHIVQIQPRVHGLWHNWGFFAFITSMASWIWLETYYNQCLIQRSHPKLVGMEPKIEKTFEKLVSMSYFVWGQAQCGSL